MRLIFKIAVLLLITLNNSLSMQLDTLVSDTTVIDINELNTSTTFNKNDIENFKPGQSRDIDTTIRYNAKEFVKLNLKNKSMYLKGESNLDYDVQKIESEIILIDFNKSTLTSQGIKDSLGHITGYPKFTDKGEQFVGEKIIYNFKTKQGTITLGETEVSEGYYFGSKIKRVSEDELFVRDGCYTTCDAPHPHFYFGSPEMKVISKDRVFLDPIIFYVEDMPIFILPFGLFFPNKSGRQSGLMIPSFFFSNSKGVVLQDLGYYFALSDYYDTQVNIDFFSKGGFTLKNSTRWKLLDVLDGNMQLEYGKTRSSVDDEYGENFKFALRHNHTIDPQQRIVANMSFMSSDYNRNTNFTNLQDNLKQNVTSNASYSKSFDNGSSISVSFNRDQNIIDSTDRTTFPRVNFSLPQLQPLKSLIPAGTWVPDWLRELSFSYSTSGSYYAENVKDPKNPYSGERVHNYKSSINHNPSISVSPKLGYFNINPYIRFKANNYFRKLNRTYNINDSSTVDSFDHGFYTEYDYDMGVDVSTRLFGILNPNVLDIKALRHTFQPTVGFSYSPDLSTDNFGFYDSYYDDLKDEWVEYSKYQYDGGGIASSAKSGRLRYNVLNSFEAKIFQGDTLDDKNAEFFRWNFSGSVITSSDNPRDSLKFSDINMQFRIPALSAINMTANANFTLYDEANTWNESTQDYSGNLTRINTFLFENEKGFMRLTNFSMNFSTQFSSEGSDFTPSFSKDEPTSTPDTSTSVGLGQRFQQRYNYEDEQYDFYGDSSPGYSPINIPWNLSLGLQFQYSEPFQKQRITRRINLTTNFSFKITNTWSISGSAQYDFVNMELLAPNFNINKDMHCWQLSFQWWPVGYNAGFYLRFGIKAPQLQDLKIEKKDNPLLR